MTHPILQPLAAQLPESATTRRMLEEGRELKDIADQAMQERNWLKRPDEIHAENRSGKSLLEDNGYGEWFKDAEEEEQIEMIGVLQLILDMAIGLEDEDED